MSALRSIGQRTIGRAWDENARSRDRPPVSGRRQRARLLGRIRVGLGGHPEWCARGVLPRVRGWGARIRTGRASVCPGVLREAVGLATPRPRYMYGFVYRPTYYRSPTPGRRLLAVARGRQACSRSAGRASGGGGHRDSRRRSRQAGVGVCSGPVVVTHSVRDSTPAFWGGAPTARRGLHGVRGASPLLRVRSPVRGAGPAGAQRALALSMACLVPRDA
jgi:hypothetical protein